MVEALKHRQRYGSATIDGGFPTFAGKELVRSVGISGAFREDKGTAHAQVGIDKIAKALGS